MEVPLFFEDGVYRNPPPILKKSLGLTKYVIETSISLHIPDLLDPGFESPGEFVRLSKKQVRSYVGVPMIFRERVVGAISMQSFQPNDYTVDQVRLLEIVATQATIALENARLFNQMETLAMTDTLTGIYNRRQFMALSILEMERSRRYHKDFSVIMIDIDHFKKINDSYGHLAGDSVLQQIAALIQRALRSVDILGRYGGEEFCIILPETGLEKAQKVAERLRVLMEKKLMLVEGMQINATASFGVTTFTTEIDNLETLLDQADRAMYEAKKAGRNRVQAYLPDQDE